MAVPAKRDQVSLRVVTEGASASHVVNVQISGRSALLAAPTVAFEDLATQLRILLRHRSNSRVFLRSRVIHFAVSPSKLSARNPKMNHRLPSDKRYLFSDPPVSRAAPARKSAQIISKQ